VLSWHTHNDNPHITRCDFFCQENSWKGELERVSGQASKEQQQHTSFSSQGRGLTSEMKFFGDALLGATKFELPQVVVNSNQVKIIARPQNNFDFTC
jgi:hypothetical protein